MKNILIFGSSGYIGSHLSYFLTKKKYVVFCVVKKSSNLKILKKLYKENNVLNHLNIIYSNLSEISQINSIIKKYSIDIVINSASYGVQKTQKNSIKAQKINSIYALNLLKISKENNVKHFIHLSTVMEYGFGKIIKKEKSYLKGSSIYAKTKKIGGKICISYAKKNSLNYSYLRLSSIYGERQYSKNFITLLLQSLKFGKKLRLTDGNQKRDYLHIYDLQNLFFKLLTNKKNKKVLILNIASGKSYSLKNIGNIASKVINKKNNYLKWGQKKNNKDDKLDMIVSINKAVSILDWKPKISLKKGIHITYKKL